MTAMLRVERGASAWVDRLRGYVIEVNGVPVGKGGREQSLDVDVPHGEKLTLRACIDWTGSDTSEGTLVENELAVFQVGHRGVDTLTGLLSTSGYLQLDRTR